VSAAPPSERAASAKNGGPGIGVVGYVARMRSRRFTSVVAATLAVASLCVAGCHDHKDPPERAAKAHAASSAHTASSAHVAVDTQTIAGLRFLEVVTGGAAAGDTLPLIAFFHGHAANPEALRAKFAAFPGRARIILPYGPHPGDKGGYEWFSGHALTPQGEALYARALPIVEAEVATALAAIAKARPTLGKPIASGFSQGAGIAFALALWHPDLLGAVCSMAGEMPAAVFAGVSAPATKPELHAFSGDADPSAPSTERTINGFKALGYVADLKTLPGLSHSFDPAASEVFACLDRAARAAR
jgi:phospholipase/carboxylesterase